MERTFIHMPEFDRQWAEMGLNDDDLSRLQDELKRNPSVGVVMRGTGGLRKLRFAFQGKGKSGSSRVCYVDFVVFETIYLITAYPKSEKDNLSMAERNGIKQVVERLGKSLRKYEG